MSEGGAAFDSAFEGGVGEEGGVEIVVELAFAHVLAAAVFLVPGHGGPGAGDGVEESGEGLELVVRIAGALHWLDRAVEYAAGRDPHLVSFVLFRKAEIALYRHDPHETVELARRAQAADRAAGPRSLGLAASCEAQGHALTGNLRSYEEALDRAASLLAIREHDDGPVLGSVSVPDEIVLMRGWSLYELGRPGAAAELLDTQLGALPVSARRARARFGIRRALAHATNGAIDQACAAAVEVLPDVTHVDPLMSRLDLRELSRALSRWSTDPEVRRSDGKLPPHVMVYFVMALALFADDDYEEVLTKLVDPLRWLGMLGSGMGGTGVGWDHSGSSAVGQSTIGAFVRGGG